MAAASAAAAAAAAAVAAATAGAVLCVALSSSALSAAAMAAATLALIGVKRQRRLALVFGAKLSPMRRMGDLPPIGPNAGSARITLGGRLES
eukprot:5324497-Pleurochrysis_carterae.AAC.1